MNPLQGSVGKFDGGGDLGGLWMVFLWVPCRGMTGEGKRKRQVTFRRVVCSFDDTCFQTVPFFMLYVIY